MLYANWNDQKVKAQPSLKGATCPGCGGPVIPKCGSFVAHHFAHLQRECDPWSEGETDWHLGWKALFPPEWCEVKLGLHRADVHTRGLTIEFQHSPISIREVRLRTWFYEPYGRVIWVVDARDADIELEISGLPKSLAQHWKQTGFDRRVSVHHPALLPNLRPINGYQCYRVIWHRFRKAFGETRFLYLDVGHDWLIQLIWDPCQSLDWRHGHLRTRQWFIREMVKKYVHPRPTP